MVSGLSGANLFSSRGDTFFSELVTLCVYLYYRNSYIRKSMANYRAAFWLNTLSFLLVFALIVYTKLFGPSVSSLFLHPSFYPSLNIASLTRAFQILCAVPPVVCGFSFALLKTIQPQSKENLFILCSALLTGGFLVNEIYRIHIALSVMEGGSKLGAILVYGICAGAYGVAFRRKIQSTPYSLLLTGTLLLAFGIVMDSLGWGTEGISSLLEGLPKLFSELNITLYFWFVCYWEILRSLKPLPRA